METGDSRSKLPTIKDGEELPGSVLEGPVLDDVTVLGWPVGFGLKVDDVNGSDRVWICHGSEERRQGWFWDFAIVPWTGTWTPAEVCLCGWVLGEVIVISGRHGG